MSDKKVICHDGDLNEFEIDAELLSFRPSVYGVLIENDKVFLSKQWDGYDFPGGGMETHETMEEALKREFFEETGIEIEVSSPVYCGTSFFTPRYLEEGKKQYWNCFLAYFLVRKIGGEITNIHCDEEEKKYIGLPEWISLDKLDKIKFYNSVDSPGIVKKALALSGKLNI